MEKMISPVFEKKEEEKRIIKTLERITPEKVTVVAKETNQQAIEKATLVLTKLTDLFGDKTPPILKAIGQEGKYFLV